MWGSFHGLVSHLHVFFGEMSIIWKDTCTPVFITALFTIARTWKQPKCPLTEERIKKMWYIYTMEYYPAIIRNKIDCAICRDVDGPGESSNSERGKQILYNISYMWNLEKWYRWTACKAEIVTDVENRLTVTKWRKGMNWEIGIDIYTLLCRK